MGLSCVGSTQQALRTVEGILRVLVERFQHVHHRTLVLDDLDDILSPPPKFIGTVQRTAQALTQPNSTQFDFSQSKGAFPSC